MHLLDTELCSFLPFCDDGPHGQDSILVSHISPCGRRESDEVVTEVDECVDVLPLVEIVVIQITAYRVDTLSHNHHTLPLHVHV